jgi:thiol:disulfide interchange protein DsbD
LFGAPLTGIAPLLPVQETGKQNWGIHSQVRETGIQAISGKATICDEKPKYSDFLHLPHGLKGYFDYDQALQCARELDKPVLVDFVGHSCKNCKKMYASVWSDPKVLELLANQYIIAALYVDDRTALPAEEWYVSPLDGKEKKTIGRQHADFQVREFNSNALPMYAIVNARGEIITEQRIYTYNPSVNDFLDYLNEGIR